MQAWIAIIKSITYKNQEIDRGLILGRRKYRWCLKSKYEPLWVKSGNYFVSKLSPHKTNFDIYIPVSELKEGKIYIIQDKMKRVKIKVSEINKFQVTYETINEPEKTQHEPFSEESIPF